MKPQIGDIIYNRNGNGMEKAYYIVDGIDKDIRFEHILYILEKVGDSNCRYKRTAEYIIGNFVIASRANV